MSPPVPQKIDDDLWVVDHPFSVGGLQLGTRTTLVKTADGLVMHSPGPLSGALKEQIAAIGDVAHVVAPNTMHYLFFEENTKAYPQATPWTPPALRKKAPHLPVGRDLAEGSAWGEGLKALRIAGAPKLEETVFYHPGSRTLIVTDLVFNLRHSSHWYTRIFMTMNGGYGKFGPTRLFRHLLVADAKALGKSLEKLEQWDIERVIMGHGEVLPTGGGQALRESYAWALNRQ